jgi:hypothetical protein
LTHKIAIIDSGIEGMSVYFIRVSYLPNCIFNEEEGEDGDDDGNELRSDDLFLRTIIICPSPPVMTLSSYTVSLFIRMS